MRGRVQPIIWAILGLIGLLASLEARPVTGKALQSRSGEARQARGSHPDPCPHGWPP
jgi:hypothetical protein